MATDLPKSPARSRCASPYSSRQVMVKGRSLGVHWVAASQSRTLILSMTDLNRLVGETVTGRAGTRTSRLRSRAPSTVMVEVSPSDRTSALSTCSGLNPDCRPLGCVRGGMASKSTSSTPCSSARKAGGGAGRSCQDSTAPPPAATPSVNARSTTACRRHAVGIFSNNGGREGPTRRVSVGWCTVSSSGSSSGSCTCKPYARRASPDCRGRATSGGQAAQFGARGRARNRSACPTRRPGNDGSHRSCDTPTGCRT